MNNDTSPILQKAYQFIKTGHKQQALDLLTPITYADPDNLQAWYLLGFAHTDPERRIHAFEQVLRLDPANQPAQKQLAKLRAVAVVAPITEAALAKNARLAKKEMAVVLRWVGVIAILLVFCVGIIAISSWLILRDALPASVSATIVPTQLRMNSPTLHVSATFGPSPSPSSRPSVTPYPRRATGTPLPASPTVLSVAQLAQILTEAAPTPNMTLVVIDPIDVKKTYSAVSNTKSGLLASGQSVSVPFEIDNTGNVDFILHWPKQQPLVFTLTTPEGQVIDAAYAKAHPDVAILGESQIGFSYYVKKSSVGTWKINLTASGPGQYEVVAHFNETTLILRTGGNGTTHKPGDLANIVVRVEDRGVGVAGVTVTAKLKAPHSDYQNVTFIDMGDGFYGLAYRVPNTSGDVTLSITAIGANQGIKFTRFTPYLFRISP